MNHPPVYSKKNLSRAPEGARLSHMLLTRHACLDPRLCYPAVLGLHADQVVLFVILQDVAIFLGPQVANQGSNRATHVSSLRPGTNAPIRGDYDIVSIP